MQNWAPKANAFRICNSLCTFKVDIVMSNSLSMVVANTKLLHKCEHHFSGVLQLPEMKGSTLDGSTVIKKLTSWATILGYVEIIFENIEVFPPSNFLRKVWCGVSHYFLAEVNLLRKGVCVCVQEGSSHICCQPELLLLCSFYWYLLLIIKC